MFGLSYVFGALVLDVSFCDGTFEAGQILYSIFLSSMMVAQLVEGLSRGRS